MKLGFFRWTVGLWDARNVNVSEFHYRSKTIPMLDAGAYNKVDQCLYGSKCGEYINVMCLFRA